MFSYNSVSYVIGDKKRNNKEVISESNMKAYIIHAVRTRKDFLFFAGEGGGLGTLGQDLETKQTHNEMAENQGSLQRLVT